jgi:RND family efflux transporter MFP subunit
VRTFAGEVEQVKAQRAAKKIELDKDLQVADSGLQIGQWNLDRQTVRCPIQSATVLVRPLTVGTRVGVNDQIMLVADVRPEKLLMRAQVDEEDITKVKTGGTVRMTLYAYERREFKGVVKKVYEKADPDRRTFEVDVEMIDKDAGFQAGMTGELAFIEQEKDIARIIPSQAVQGGRVCVVKEGRIAETDVKLGLRSVERTEVVSGLGDGDEVVISPTLDMQIGQRVRTQWMDPVQAAMMNRPKKEEIFKGGF